MPQSSNGIGNVILTTVGAAVVSCVVTVSTAVVADRLDGPDFRQSSRVQITQSHQVDRTKKGDALSVKSETSSPMLTGCESAFSLPSPEALIRKPSRCVTERPSNADETKFVALR